MATLRTAGYDVHRLTLRMLLQHTGGLRDDATLRVILDRVSQAPAHRWTRAEQLQLAMDDGPPLGPAGAAFHYSDTGYILLGEVIETVTGQSMPRALAELPSYRRLGISHTWFETLEPQPAAAPARTLQWHDDVDAAGFDPSIDLFGGGGLVSNLDDLARFYRAVVRGEVFRRPGTAATMLAVSPQSLAAGGPGYGTGIARLEQAGVVCHGHGGFWGEGRLALPRHRRHGGCGPRQHPLAQGAAGDDGRGDRACGAGQPAPMRRRSTALRTPVVMHRRRRPWPYIVLQSPGKDGVASAVPHPP